MGKIKLLTILDQNSKGFIAYKKVILVFLSVLICSCSEHKTVFGSLKGWNTIFIDSVEINKTVRSSESLIQQEIFIYISTNGTNIKDMFTDTCFSFRFKSGQEIYVLNSSWLKADGKSDNLSALGLWLNRDFDFNLREMDSCLIDLLYDNTLFLYQDNNAIDSFFLDYGKIKKKYYLDYLLIDSNDYMSLNTHRREYLIPPTR